MTIFSRRYEELKPEKIRLSEPDFKELCKALDPNSAEDRSFFSWVRYSSEIHLSEKDYFVDILDTARVLNSPKFLQKRRELAAIDGFLDAIKQFVLNSDRENVLYKLMIFYELGASKEDMEELYVKFREQVEPSTTRLFCRYFREAGDVGYYLDALKTHLALADGYAHISADDIEYICDYFGTGEFQELVEFLYDSANRDEFGPISCLSLSLEESWTSRLIKAAERASINSWAKAMILDLIVKIFTAPPESFDFKGIHDHERDVLWAPFIFGLGELWRAWDSGFITRFFKAVCESEWGYKTGRAFSKFIGRFAGIEDARELWTLFVGENPYADWWFVFYDAIRHSERPDAGTLSESVRAQIPSKVEARELRSKEWQEEAERGRNKRKEEFESNVRSVIDIVKSDAGQYSSWLLREYWEHIEGIWKKMSESNHDVNSILDTPEMLESIHEQLRRVFAIDSKRFTWKISEELEGNWRTWHTNNQVIGNGGYGKSLLIADKIGYDTTDFHESIAGYIPFCYEEELQAALRLLWPLRKEDADYLMSVYDWTQGGDLKYHLFQSFLSILNANGNAEIFKVANKAKFQRVLVSAVEDERYGYSERLRAIKILFANYPIKSIARKLFDKYEDGRNYFNDVLPTIEEYWREHAEWKIQFSANRLLVKKGEAANVEWTIKQLKKGLIAMRNPSLEGVHLVRPIEDEMLWNRDEVDSLVNVLWLVHKPTYVDAVNELLEYAFDLLKSDSTKYSIYAEYLFRAVVNYYKWLKGKKNTHFSDLRHIVRSKPLSIRAWFMPHLNSLDKRRSESDRLRDRIEELEREKEDLRSRLENTQLSAQKSVVLFVEWITDREYLKKAWGLFFPSRPMPFSIIACGGCGGVWTALRVDGNSDGLLQLGLLDHDGFVEIDSTARMDDWRIWEKWWTNDSMVYMHKNWKNRFIFPLQLDEVKNAKLLPQIYSDPTNRIHLWKSSRFDIEHLFYDQLDEIGKLSEYFSDTNDDITRTPFVKLAFKKKPEFKNRIDSLPQVSSFDDEKRLYAWFKPTLDLIDSIIAYWRTQNNNADSAPSPTSDPTP